MNKRTFRMQIRKYDDFKRLGLLLAILLVALIINQFIK